MASPISSRTFGVLPAGQTVEAWTLTGRGGLVLEAITYGGIVTRLLAPDRNGSAGDVVLGFNDLDSYLGGHPYFGAITGRVAGRISDAAFTLDGDTYRWRGTIRPIICMAGLKDSTSAFGARRRSIVGTARRRCGLVIIVPTARRATPETCTSR